MVICLERGADLHMAQLMPLPVTISCFSKIQIGFTFLVPVHLGNQGPLNVCVCVCVHAQSAELQPIVTDVLWSVCVCLSVGYNRESCKSGWTDWDVACIVDLGGPRNHVLRLGSVPPSRRGNLLGFPGHWSVLACLSSERCCSTGLQTCLQGTVHHGKNVAWKCTLPPRVTSAAFRQNFSDHLLFVPVSKLYDSDMQGLHSADR